MTVAFHGAFTIVCQIKIASVANGDIVLIITETEASSDRYFFSLSFMTQMPFQMLCSPMALACHGRDLEAQHQT